MRQRTRATCILILVLAIPTMGVRAQQPDSVSRNPTAVAKAFFDAIAAAQWKAAAGYLDLDAFESFWHSQIEQARESRMSPPVTAERLVRSDTSMPRAVAEFEARRLNENRENGSRLSYQFADITSVDSLAALTVLDAAARWLEARDIRYAMRRSIEAAKARGRCVPDVPADSLIPPQPPRIVLGTIVRDTEAYVLNSSGAEPDLSRLPPAISWLAPPPNVLQLRRRGAAWRIIGGREMLGNGDQIIGVASCESAPKR